MKTHLTYFTSLLALVTLGLFHQIYESNVAYAVRMLGITSLPTSTTTSSESKGDDEEEAGTGGATSKQHVSIGIRQVGDVLVVAEPPKIPVPHVGCPDLEPMTLQWHRYSETQHSSNSTIRRGGSNTTTSSPRKRLLVGLMSGNDDYAQMLDVTGRINKAYAKRFGHDVLLLQGIYLVDSSDKCEPPAHRATFNKIGILQEALKHRDQYDQLLLLDTDAMMYNLSYDVRMLMDETQGFSTQEGAEEEDSPTMLVAHRVKKQDVCKTWDVNIGVTLWNLHHPRTRSVVRAWEKESKKAFKHNLKVGDQRTLHTVLKGEVEHVHSLSDEFAYGHGTVIRHYIRRRTNKGWKDPNVLTDRLDLLRVAADEVCVNFPEECAAINAVSSNEKK